MKNKMLAVIQNLKSHISSERGDIGDSFMVIIGIGVAVIIMFIYPIMTIADQTDSMAEETIDAAAAKFIDVCCTSGQITPETYQELIRTINSTGIICDTEIIVGVLDENANKKAVQVQLDKWGENGYYNIYNAQIVEVIDPDGGTAKPYKLKPGDRIEVRIKNSSKTNSDNWDVLSLTVLGKGVVRISVSESGIVMTSGGE